MNNLLFVDDEAKVLQGLQRQLHGMRGEWRMDFVDGGAKALEFMKSNSVDVIVSDMIMPGMDGAELLIEVMKRYPNTIRIVLSGQTTRETALRLVGPAHQYLSKPCDAEELRTAIARAFAMRDLLTNERLKKMVTQLKSLPTLPSLYMQLMDELRKEDASIERIGQIISKDPGMTTKILQLVNSAFFGLAQQIADVQEAVMYLGITTVRALVLSLKVFSQFDGKKIKGFSLESLADHCWRTGAFARKIAKAEQCDPIMEDQCFLAGLLHDVGQLVLAASVPNEYGQMLEHSREEGKPLDEAEAEKFGASHAEIGGYLLGLWGLPNPLIEAVTLHHHPSASVASAFSPVIAVHVASAFAHEISGNHSGGQIDTACIAKLRLDNHFAMWRELCLAEAVESSIH